LRDARRQHEVWLLLPKFAKDVRDSMSLRTAALWIHVLCGVVWVGTCASFVLVGSVLASEVDELRNFALVAAPKINRVNLFAACAIPLTGIVNIFFATRAHGGVLPSSFVTILAVKISLFAAMAGTVTFAWDAEAKMRRALAGPDIASGILMMRRLMLLYRITIVMGGITLILGLWLSGT
jgi:hypothetical protein